MPLRVSPWTLPTAESTSTLKGHTLLAGQRPSKGPSGKFSAQGSSQRKSHPFWLVTIQEGPQSCPAS